MQHVTCFSSFTYFQVKFRGFFEAFPVLRYFIFYLFISAHLFIKHTSRSAKNAEIDCADTYWFWLRSGCDFLGRIGSWSLVKNTLSRCALDHPRQDCAIKITLLYLSLLSFQGTILSSIRSDSWFQGSIQSQPVSSRNPYQP